ncbi:MAG: hypothetical protein WC333_08880 [Dehalococcoidia bacterium]|jgi:phage-related minor tail protein
MTVMEAIHMELYDIASDISVAIVAKCEVKTEDVKKVFGIVLKEVIESSEDTLPNARDIAKSITISYIKNNPSKTLSVTDASKLFGKVLKEVYATFPEGKMLDEYLGRRR